MNITIKKLLLVKHQTLSSILPFSIVPTTPLWRLSGSHYWTSTY